MTVIERPIELSLETSFVPITAIITALRPSNPHDILNLKVNLVGERVASAERHSMDILNIHVRNWYKAFHVLCACIWFGSVLSVILVYLFTYQAKQSDLLVNNNSIMEKMDYWLIIPSSICCYFSGLLLSWKTNWGFIKYKWIIVKLVLGTLLILFGMFFLNTWIVHASETVTENIAEYKLTQKKLGISMMMQATVIAFLIVISNLKPWGRTTNK